MAQASNTYERTKMIQTKTKHHGQSVYVYTYYRCVYIHINMICIRNASCCLNASTSLERLNCGICCSPFSRENFEILALRMA